MSILIWKGRSISKLTFGSIRISGRGNQGKIVRYHRGGGCKRLVRVLDYGRYVWNIFGFVYRLEYDPKRTALIALIVYSNGVMTYTLASEGLVVGDCIFARENIVFHPGNATYIQNIPIGVKINSIGLFPNNGAQFIRAAGTYATVITKSDKVIVVKLKSGELRRILFNCTATIGAVSNFRYMYRNFKKAGTYRLKG
jgi:large subunit ribosomal protein L2